MGSLTLESIKKSFGAAEVLKGIDLEVKDGEFVIFVGPSGCGKSTLLRVIAGLEDATAGKVLIDGKPVDNVPPAKRGIAMVFQSYALYPHLNVRDNMGLGLKQAGRPREEIKARVATASSMLGLDDYLQRRPAELSGGQRQRVAIGRAIVRNPKLFLFDEPLSNLDAGLRAQMRIEIARLHAELKTTMIYVTHDQVEAMTLADRIVVLNKGRVEQQGAPLDLYERPDNMFVASFLGQPRINFLDVVAEGGDEGPVLRLASGHYVSFPPGLSSAVSPGTSLVLGIRPDSIVVSTEPSEGGIPGSLELVEHLGSETLVHVRLPDAEGLTTVTIPGKARHERGMDCWLSFGREQALLFGRDGARIK